jgi:shikimate kinase
VLREENVKKLKALGPLVLLSSRPEVIEKRLENSGSRPLLNVPDRREQILDVLNVRDPIYNKVADFAVDTSDISVKDAVEKIIDYYEGVKK